MKKLLLILSLSGVSAFAQNSLTDVGVDNLHRFRSSCSVTTSASTAKCAISVPATGTKRVFLESVVITTPASVTVTFERGGTAPTATAQTSIARNTTATSVATVYQGSTDAGAGTSSVVYTNPAATDTLYDLSGEAFPRGSANTLQITAGSSTGTVQMVFFWAQEK